MQDHLNRATCFQDLGGYDKQNKKLHHEEKIGHGSNRNQIQKCLIGRSGE